MRNREIAAHGGCNLFLRPKSKERATNTAFRWGYGVDSKHSKRVGIILMDVRAKLQWNAETAPNNIPQCLQ